MHYSIQKIVNGPPQAEIKNKSYNTTGTYTLKIISLGWHVLFIGVVIRVLPFSANIVIQKLAAALTVLGACLIVFVLAPTIITHKLKMPRKLYVWTLLASLWFILMMGQTVYKSPLDLGTWLLQGTGLFVMPFIPALGHPYFKSKVRKVFKIHILMGSMIFLPILYQNWQVITATYVDRREIIEAVSGRSVFYPAGFLTVSLYMENRAWRLYILGIISLLFFLSLFTTTRQGVALQILYFFMLLWVIFRTKNLGRIQLLIANKKYLFVFISGVIITLFALFMRYEGASNLFVERFYTLKESSTYLKNSRVYEAKEFINQMNVEDYFIGRGIMGRWNNYLLANRPDGSYKDIHNYHIHIGYLYLLLKGGIPLIFIMAFMFHAGLKNFLRSRDIELIAAGGMCLWLCLKTFIGNIAGTHHPLFYLTLYCFGICMYGGKTNQKQYYFKNRI